MKTILTFAAGLLLTLTTMAAERPPSVIVKAPRHYEIMIDGRTFHNDNTIRLDRISRGMHSIRVYERGRGIFGRMRLVSAKNFFVRNNDLRIMVSSNGYVDIDERGYDRRDGRWDNDRRYDNSRGYDNERDWDHNDRGYDRSRGF